MFCLVASKVPSFFLFDIAMASSRLFYWVIGVVIMGWVMLSNVVSLVFMSWNVVDVKLDVGWVFGDFDYGFWCCGVQVVFLDLLMQLIVFDF